MNQTGLGLISSMIILSVILLLGSCLLKISATGFDIATSFSEGVKAQYIAEAGIKHAIIKLKNDSEFVKETENKAILQSSKNDFTEGQYKVYINGDENQRTVLSIGKVNNSRRKLSVVINLPNATNNEFKIINWNN
ncbi:MAG: hypothetical protein H6Q70_1745 [Firmicutes bacterium]|nr:hypothetical protein [Bacillota bacterium]